MISLHNKGCTSDPKITKKKTQTAYENLYTGPEFALDFRYAQVDLDLFEQLLTPFD